MRTLQFTCSITFLITYSALAADAPKPDAAAASVPAVAQPEAPPAPAKPAGLDQATIDSTVKKDLGKIRSCYNDNVKDLSPKPAGIVTTRIMVGADGKVISVDIAGSDLNNQKVESCLTEALKAVVFPAPGISVRVDYPFRFVPSTGGKKKSAS